MPKQRFQRLSSEKQERILKVAAEEFATHGFDGASYNQIIERAGVSKGAMYYYFEDKLDLYLTVLIPALEPLWDVLGEVPEVSEPEAFWGGIAERFELAMALFLGSPSLIGLVKSLAGVRGLGEAELHALYGRVYGWLAQLVAVGQGVGAVRTDLPPELLIQLVAAMGEAHDLWLAQRVESLSAAELAQTVPRLMDLIRRMVRP
ncbi:MAG: TetR/AcrR family transcriptional regulator [Deltaproteobacteria bacterium]|nr:TetR/AcrR family transcriptional regulator [Deltaproteobacteria bacterium]